MSNKPQYVVFRRTGVVLARGKLNSCLVEFADGLRVVTSRYAVRKKK